MDKKHKRISEERAFARMARLCSQKEYSVYDISQKLNRMNLSVQSIENIVSQLIEDNFINEERFARSFIIDKLKLNKWGKKKIEFALRQKQVSQEIIHKVFNEFSDSELNQSLEYVLNKKWESIKGKTEYEKKGKLVNYALGRGFEMKEILSCMQKMNLDIIDEE